MMIDLPRSIWQTLLGVSYERGRTSEEVSAAHQALWVAYQSSTGESQDGILRGTTAKGGGA